MEIQEILNLFCDKSSYREYYRSPFAIDGATYFTDGWALIRVPGVHGVDLSLSAPDGAADILKPFSDLPICDFTPFDKSVYLATRHGECKLCNSEHVPNVQAGCPECDGDGEIEFNSGTNLYTVECATCDGEGTIDDDHARNGECPDRMESASITINGLFYVAKMIMLPGLMVYRGETGINNTLYFRFDGGDGLMMGRKISVE